MTSDKVNFTISMTYYSQKGSKLYLFRRVSTITDERHNTVDSSLQM